MKSNSRPGLASLDRVECSGPPHDVVGGLALPLQQQVGLADGEGLGIGLLAVQMGGDLLAVLGGEFLQRLLGHGQHTAGAAGAVVQQVRARGDLVGDRLEDQLRHQPDRIARSPVLARLLVVLLVEAAHQFLEDRAHAVVVEAGMLYRAVGVAHRIGAQIDVGRGKLLDQRAQGVGAGQPRDLIANSKLSRISCTLGENPSRYAWKSAVSCCRLARARRSLRVKREVL